MLFDAVVRPHRWLSGLGFAVLMATVGVVSFGAGLAFQLVCAVGSGDHQRLDRELSGAAGGRGVGCGEHHGVAEFVVFATMLGVLVLLGGQSNKPSTSAIP